MKLVKDALLFGTPGKFTISILRVCTLWWTFCTNLLIVQQLTNHTGDVNCTRQVSCDKLMTQAEAGFKPKSPTWMTTSQPLKHTRRQDACLFLLVNKVEHPSTLQDKVLPLSSLFLLKIITRWFIYQRAVFVSPMYVKHYFSVSFWYTRTVYFFVQ